MRVCFLTLGTRGDVQPYIALAKYIIEQGHQAIICTSLSFKEMIEKEGVEYQKASLDYMEIAKTDIGKKVLENPLMNISSALKLAKEVINPGYQKSFIEFYNASLDADIIVYHPKVLVAVDIAEKLNIPCVNMALIPMIEPIKEFANIVISNNKSYGSFLNKLTYSVNKKSDSNYIKIINEFRSHTLNLKSRKAGAYAYYQDDKKIPIVYPISKALFEDVTSWNNNVYLSGFFFLDTNATLSKKTQDFISENPNPIVVTFSSMPLKKPQKFIEILEESLEKTNNKAILLVGNSSIDFTSNNRIMITNSEPHSLLFDKAKAVIHHGGVGTTAAALIAGKPQIIFPFAVDQPFWAKRMYESGVALKQVKFRLLNSKIFTKMLQDIEDINIINKAIAFKEELEKENGVADALEYLLKLIK